MKVSNWTSRSVFVLITSLLLSASAVSTMAQTVTDPYVGITTTKRLAGGASSSGSPSQPLKPLKSATRDRAKLAAYNNAAWYVLAHEGSCKDPQSTTCANDAVLLANSTCSSSALIFQKGTAAWQKAQFALVIAAAGFTGVGSAATLAGSTTVPKVFSTLGGTTGLGAVEATTNTNISDNQAGVSAVNTIQAELQKLQPVNGESDTNQKVFTQADGYAGQCVAANPVGTTAKTGGQQQQPAPKQGGGQQQDTGDGGQG